MDGDSDENSQAQGRVKEATRDWTVKTDEVLAHRLQEEEISKHLTGNKSRNELIRVDNPIAAAVQKKADEQARLRLLMIRKQAEEDAKVAWELQKKQRAAAAAAAELANEYPSTSQDYLLPSSSSSRHFDSIMDNGSNEGAIKKTLTEKEQKKRTRNGRSGDNPSMEIENLPSMPVPSRSRNQYRDDSPDLLLREIETALGVPIEIIDEERRRLIQEEHDAEIAKKLQLAKTPFDESDREYARVLQAKEYQKYIKSKEKQRLKAIAKAAARPGGSDTYSRPVDCLGMPRENPNDPYYMEPMNAQLPQLPVPGQFSGAAEEEAEAAAMEERRLRAPPAPPRPRRGGRPRMAEPPRNYLQPPTEPGRPPSTSSTESFDTDTSDEDQDLDRDENHPEDNKKSKKNKKKKTRLCTIH